MDSSWVEDLALELPRHGRLIAAIRDRVAADEWWRWFDVSCSLGAGRGDEWSDIDGAIGYVDDLGIAEVEAIGRSLVSELGDVVDALVHRMDGWQPATLRFAVEYADAVQLDLVAMPATWMKGLRHGEVAIVDKDGDLAGTATSQLYGPPDEAGMREWVLMAWWWVSDIAKYLQRGSLFEAVERIGLVRDRALRIYAASIEVPYPSFGLTSLLDYEPFELPDGLAKTYGLPNDPTAVAEAAVAVVALLTNSSDRAARHLGYDLSTPWARSAQERLAAAQRSRD